MRNDDMELLVKGGAFCLIIGGGLAIGLAISAEHKAEMQRKTALIESGVCEMDRSEWHTPAPTMMCSWSGENGNCRRWVAVEQDPYLRHHYVCPGKDFWFRDQPKKD